ncbi:SRS domain-containing protein [Neospora caninum Liverpool]|uniref:SRS domain-containing protein n=1 Tax=Neospora caninum (strain Liverpool) TaxID=572307 RepID=F0VKG9_NEOCL|nr:SRS domain-containing protein [Neospora caninum Liverpool]CBZ54570.1 SRS domain-containing protein [Neospora caninum Liverpool]CEL69284.1 TPA: SRS domain-containing protein [Neospora caninum Liverpool]|eukprot:XP_003884600.1 SRS domain-containing protein [Neospora caninum Liverpool]
MAVALRRWSLAALIATAAAMAVLHAAASLAEGSESTLITCDNGQKNGSAGPENPLYFKCGESMTLNPTSTTQVYLDAKCTDQAELNTVVPGATLNGPSQRPAGLQGTNDVYTLTINTAPEATKTLCYKCEGKSTPVVQHRSEDLTQSNKKECKIVITVAAAPTVSTTAPHATSDTDISTSTTEAPVASSGTVISNPTTVTAVFATALAHGLFLQ